MRYATLMKLIVGLGNPGKEYVGSRHNAGFDFLDRFAATTEATAFKMNKKFEAETSEVIIDGAKVLLAKPQTFMNNSGSAVQKLLGFYKLNLSDLIIVYDEMDFEPGKFAFSFGRGSAGHNGIESIAQSLGTADFARLRIGIGRPKDPSQKPDYVLSRPNTDDQKKIGDALEKAAEAATTWVSEGLTKAMNLWNGV